MLEKVEKVAGIGWLGCPHIEYSHQSNAEAEMQTFQIYNTDRFQNEPGDQSETNPSVEADPDLCL